MIKVKDITMEKTVKKVGVALLGLGTVGTGTYQILTSLRAKIREQYSVDIEVRHVLERSAERVKALGISEKIVAKDIETVISDTQTSIVCEFFGGIEPAKSFLIASLRAGKSIVTANKEMFAKNWAELDAAAKEGNAGLYFEATCAGGVPIIRALQESMQGNNIKSVMGIVNGTTNFILSKMSDEGKEYASVLKEAQDLGYAEANPSADVDAFDSMYKLSILSTIAFRKKVPITKIYREGITQIDKVDIEMGKKFGFALKLLAIGKFEHGKIEARVHPAFIPLSHPLASVKGSFNAVHVLGDNVGDLMFYGRGAGALPTGSAIVSDIVFCATSTTHNHYKLTDADTKVADCDFSTDFECEYYLRMSVADKTGVLAKLASTFANNGVSIASLQQIDKDGVAEIVFMLHKTRESKLNKAIAEIKAIPDVKSIGGVIRIER